MKHETTAMRLREALSDSGLSARELSENAGILESSVSHYVNGSHKPSNINAGKMADVLKVNPLWLMGFDVPKYQPTESGTKRIYYLDPETAALAQELHDNRDLRMLFDAARDAKPSDLQIIADLAKRLKETNPDG